MDDFCPYASAAIVNKVQLLIYTYYQIKLGTVIFAWSLLSVLWIEDSCNVLHFEWVLPILFGSQWDLGWGGIGVSSIILYTNQYNIIWATMEPIQIFSNSVSGQLASLTIQSTSPFVLEQL